MRRALNSYYGMKILILRDWLDTRGTWPLARNPDRNWCHRHTSLIFFLAATHGSMDSRYGMRCRFDREQGRHFEPVYEIVRNLSSYWFLNNNFSLKSKQLLEIVTCWPHMSHKLATRSFIYFCEQVNVRLAIRSHGQNLKGFLNLIFYAVLFYVK